jgi:LuxR family maltose regulon positive regulatory protein
MPRVPLHALIWSRDQGCYALYIQNRLVQQIRLRDEAAWLAWLREVSSFAFHGASGSLNVYLEARSPAGQYWYAYHTKEGRTRKRYLGRTETLKLSRLEETALSLSHEQQPTQALGQGMLVLVSRLAPPRLPNALVERERLLSALDGALSTPLTLVCAPAGFGKTTLLSDWASQHLAQVAWLSLSELDNSPPRFWVALIAALRRCPSLTPSFGETMLTLLQSPQPPPLSPILTTLLHELESRKVRPAPLMLIVDDYQIIEDPTIHEGIRFFLERLPAHLHLVLSSRVDPDLPLARLRARGQLTEIRAADLRFQEAEASRYLGHMLASTLTEAEVRKVVSRTEGWIVGLQLAALAMQKHEDRTAFLQALTGSQRYLLDYVQEEILARLSARVRDFLLHCSILSRLDASVCQAVTAEPTRAESRQMLAFLERANLFLVPLDEEQRSYRLHDLFREALLATLHTTQSEMEPILHRRAARFYEAEGQWHEAIAHWLAAADFSTAARLMEQTVEQFWVRGEAATMTRWVLALPEPLVREHARLLLTTALYLFHTVTQTTRERWARVHQQVRQLMARVETSLQTQAEEGSDQTSTTDAVSPVEDREARTTEEVLLRFRLRLLHMSLAVSEAASTGAYERLSAMQQEIEEADAREEEAIWRMVPMWASFLLHHTVRREGARLVPRLLEAKERVNWSKSSYASIRVRQYLALAALEAGQLRLAYEESLAALDSIEQMTGYALLKGYFESVLARVLYQWNRLEEARSRLQTLLHEASAWLQLDLLGRGYVELLQVALAWGEGSLAQQALHEVEQLVQRERFGTYPGMLPALRAQWWLAQRQLKAASDWAVGVVFAEGAWERGSYDAFPVVIRVYFAELRWTEAAALLERWHAHLDRPANIAITITYLAQFLVALHQVGKSEQACEIAARLLALTQPEGYLRVYLDEGEPMRQALLALLTPHSRQHELAPSTTTYISKLLASFEHEKQGASRSLEAIPTLKPTPSPASQASVASFAQAFSLTRREQEVLRLLAAGASNQEIAQTLVIELPTVKKHVSNLLGKLGVTSRTQAIREARARSLL